MPPPPEPARPASRPPDTLPAPSAPPRPAPTLLSHSRSSPYTRSITRASIAPMLLPSSSTLLLYYYYFYYKSATDIPSCAPYCWILATVRSYDEWTPSYLLTQSRFYDTAMYRALTLSLSDLTAPKIFCTYNSC